MVGVGVGRCAEFGGATTENLCFGLELGGGFQPDHRFKFHVYPAGKQQEFRSGVAKDSQ